MCQPNGTDKQTTTMDKYFSAILIDGLYKKKDSLDVHLQDSSKHSCLHNDIKQLAVFQELYAQ